MRLLLAEDEQELSHALVTILTRNNYSVDAVDNGRDALDYLTKLFSMKELLARIRAMTRRQESSTDAVVTLGNVSLNRSTYTVSTSSEAFRLANKEYQMLEMLMIHPYQVISAEQFMDKIWGYDSETDQNVVWVYISFLRKKLVALGADISIKATRGLGYSLEKNHD